MKINSIKAALVAAMLMGASFGAQSQSTGAGCYGPGCNKEGTPTDSHIEGRHCYQAIANWQKRGTVLSGRDRLRLGYERPSYNCFAAYVKGYHTGQYLTSWVQPSLEEYEAWGLALDEYMSQAFIMAYNEPRQLPESDVIVSAVARNIATANRALIKAGRDYLIAQNPMFANLAAARTGSEDSNTTDLCSAAQLDTVKGIKNKNIRDGALARLADGCKGADTRRAKIAADKAEKRAKADAYRVPTLADLQPIWGSALPPFKRPYFTLDVTAKFFSTPDLPSKTIGSAGAKVTRHYVLDLADYRSKLSLAAVWPMVRDGQLKLQISPTSLISGNVGANAALMASTGPFELINNWLEHHISDRAAPLVDAAQAQLATAAHKAAVLKVDAILIEQAVSALPMFRVEHSDGRVAEHRSAGVGLGVGNAGEVEFGLTDSRIYTQAQVDYLSTYEFQGNIGSHNNPFRVIQPLNEKVNPSFLPDYTNAREVCGADGECWKVPTAKKTGWLS